MADVEHGGFRWDASKARANLSKHGVDFVEAAGAALDPHAIIEFDSAHSREEDRFRIIGLSRRLRVLFVVTAEGVGPKVRIITARRATRKEATRYEDQRF
ncbi:MAG: BrnT family toxin [Phycisphaerales bacterium]